MLNAACVRNADGDEKSEEERRQETRSTINNGRVGGGGGARAARHLRRWRFLSLLFCATADGCEYGGGDSADV